MANSSTAIYKHSRRGDFPSLQQLSELISFIYNNWWILVWDCNRFEWQSSPFLSYERWSAWNGRRVLARRKARFTFERSTCLFRRSPFRFGMVSCSTSRSIVFRYSSPVRKAHVPEMIIVQHEGQSTSLTVFLPFGLNENFIGHQTEVPFDLWREVDDYAFRLLLRRTVVKGSCFSFRQLRGCSRKLLACLDCPQNPWLNHRTREINEVWNANLIAYTTRLKSFDWHWNCRVRCVEVTVDRTKASMKRRVYNSPPEYSRRPIHSVVDDNRNRNHWKRESQLRSRRNETLRLPFRWPSASILALTMQNPGQSEQN